METLLFGYGSLINLESASRTLKRELTRKEVATATLHGYERNWTLWDDVISNDLEKRVKAVFLNLAPKVNSYLNGVVFKISDDELEYFKVREKNYECTDITKKVVFDETLPFSDFKVFTFVGKKEYLTNDLIDEYYIFNKYIEIVSTGVRSFGDVFSLNFDNTTTLSDFPKLSGTYTFVDSLQQGAR